MARIDIEHLSDPERLLWSYGVTKPEHIDLEAIAVDKGAVVRYRPLCGCEARLVALGERACISIDTGSKPERQRFSLGHELAHWLKDRRTGGFICSQADISPQNAEAKSAEAMANAYASQLLLPDYLVVPWIAGKGASLDTAKALGTDFKASLTAAAIKTVRRCAAPAWLLCHAQTGLQWFKRSDSAPDGYVLRELNTGSAAFDMVFGAGERMSRPVFEPAHWWISADWSRGRQVRVQSVRLAEGLTLTTLELKVEAKLSGTR
jgi:hypothetical protein